jgi:membrane fusion protein (multidrug efflux system)
MLKKTLLTVLSLLILLGAIVGIKVLQIKTLIAQGASFVPPPDVVTTAVVQEQNWPPVLTAVGSLTAVQGVTVSAELEGKVVGLEFEAGRAVKAGDVLVRQDVRAESAQLRSAEAAVELAKLNLERTRQLLAKATVSQAQFDTDEVAWRQAVAAVENLRATIDKKIVRAPFAGRLGVRLINLGQFLKAGDAIVSLQALDPIFADFYLPQENLARVAVGQQVRLTGDAFPDGGVEGTITAINPDVDTATRTVRIQATVRNPRERLRPGMFVQAAVELPERNRLLVIPATAVLYAPFGDTVFVVEDRADPKTGAKSKVVRQQVVRLGVTRGDFVAVTTGLKAGETVATSGVFRLRPGHAVTVDNAVAPDARLAPKPNDS